MFENACFCFTENSILETCVFIISVIILCIGECDTLLTIVKLSLLSSTGLDHAFVACHLILPPLYRSSSTGLDHAFVA